MVNFRNIVPLDINSLGHHSNFSSNGHCYFIKVNSNMMKLRHAPLNLLNGVTKCQHETLVPTLSAVLSCLTLCFNTVCRWVTRNYRVTFYTRLDRDPSPRCSRCSCFGPQMNVFLVDQCRCCEENNRASRVC